DKAASLKEQLKNIDKNGTGEKKGEMKDLEKALKEGDFKKAEEAVEKLAKKLDDEALKPEEKEELAKQMENLKDKLKDLAEQKEEENRLDELHKKGQLSDEALAKAKEDLKKKKEELKDLDEMANELQESKEFMGKGENKKAGSAMKKAAGKMRQMQNDGKEVEDLEDKLKSVKEAQKALGQAMGQTASRFPGARRSETKDAQYKARNQQQRVDFDSTGRKEIEDFVPGKSFKKKASAEMAGDVKQASQEAPEAVERQRIPQAGKEMTKGFYEALREQADKEQKPEK